MGIIVGILVLVGGLGTAFVLLLGRVVDPPPVESSPQDTKELFAALRLHDLEVANLGLTPSNGGFTASGLSLPVNRVESEWTNWRGAPEQCMFAGWEPGTTTYPVWGTETSADPLWTEKVVSATQSLLSEGDPVAQITSRVFESEEDALAFVEEHEAALAGCTSFTTEQGETVTTTVVTPHTWETLGASSAGWVATTDAWEPLPFGPYAGEVYDVETRVLDITAGNVVTRVVLFTSPFEGVDAAMDELCAIVSSNLLEAVR